MRVRRSIVAGAATAAFALGATGASTGYAEDSDSVIDDYEMSSPAAAGKKPPKLKVRLIEFEVQPAREFTAAGKTKVVAQNKGTEKHELVVLRGEDPAALPTKPDGSVDEDQLGEDVEVGEIEGVKKKKSKSKTLNLSPPGKYILFCNIVEEEEDGTIVSHFAEGMHTVIDAS
jgi:hypothetical protein